MLYQETATTFLTLQTWQKQGVFFLASKIPLFLWITLFLGKFTVNIRLAVGKIILKT